MVLHDVLCVRLANGRADVACGHGGQALPGVVDGAPQVLDRGVVPLGVDVGELNLEPCATATSS